MKVKYISNAWKNIVYGIDHDPIKSAITSLKSGSVEDIWGTLGGDGDSDSDVNRDINGFIIPID
jgi:hypothetical protein